MRLWDYRLFKVLPKSQLLSQKKECDLIWKCLATKREIKHILINYIYNYNNIAYELFHYYMKLKEEFLEREYMFNDSKYITELISVENFYYDCNYKPFKIYHNDKYLLQCYINLEEKYIRGQKDFSQYCFARLRNYVNEELCGILDLIDKNMIDRSVL